MERRHILPGLAAGKQQVATAGVVDAHGFIFGTRIRCRVCLGTERRQQNRKRGNHQQQPASRAAFAIAAPVVFISGENQRIALKSRGMKKGSVHGSLQMS